jgi:hypothetical protein
MNGQNVVPKWVCADGSPRNRVDRNRADLPVHTQLRSKPRFCKYTHLMVGVIPPTNKRPTCVVCCKDGEIKIECFEKRRL